MYICFISHAIRRYKIVTINISRRPKTIVYSFYRRNCVWKSIRVTIISVRVNRTLLHSARIMYVETFYYTFSKTQTIALFSQIRFSIGNQSRPVSVHEFDRGEANATSIICASIIVDWLLIFRTRAARS